MNHRIDRLWCAAATAGMALALLAIMGEPASSALLTPE